MDAQDVLLENISLPSHSGLDNPSTLPIGKPAWKKNIHLLDILVAFVSFICLGIALASVLNNSLSWYLGQGTNQLILLGFLLSVMNLCLASVTPTFFLLLEARFGPSTLQNYEGILRNQLTAPRLSIFWRLLLGLMVALPVALSVAYKTFVGGESFRSVDASNYVANTSYYGMFGPPGLQTIGQKTGLAFFFNATLPFAVATTPSSGEPEPPVPRKPQSYGFNILLLNNRTTAVLDIPQPEYLSTVQALLADGESWNISASVFATVASLNESMNETPDAWNKTFQNDCQIAKQGSGGYSSQSMFNGWQVVLLNYPGNSNQTRQYIGLPPTNGSEDSCAGLSNYMYQYDIRRETCQGVWHVTRGSILLLEGTCNGTVLPAEKQLMFTHDDLSLGSWYTSALVELLGPFATPRNGSEWAIPSYTTAMAAMLWSRVAGLHGTVVDPPQFGVVSNKQVGIIYPVNDSVRYIRPTLRKSVVLCVLLAFQPLLLITILGLTFCLSSTPVGKGFGLISILSGVNPNTLDILDGATLSGELKDNVKLSLHPVHGKDRAHIKYSVVSSEVPICNGKLSSKTLYS